VKWTFASVFLLVLSVLVPAKASVNFGGVVGASSSFLWWGDDVLGRYSGLGPQAAVFADWSWTSVQFGSLGWPVVRTELGYQQRGDRTEVDIVNEHGDYLGRRWEQDWVDLVSVPVSGRWYLPLGAVSAFVSGGPRVDVFLHYTDKTQLGWSFVEDHDFSRVWLGADVGAGVDIDVGPVDIVPEIRYGFTLTSPLGEEYFNDYPGAAQLLVGVRF